VPPRRDGDDAAPRAGLPSPEGRRRAGPVTTRVPRRHAAAPSAPPPTPPAVRAPDRIPLVLLLALAAIAAATLAPAANEGAAGWDGCLLCGGRGTADALLNLGLFAPLGVALARRGVGLRAAVALAAALSASIELAQLWIPGRDPSPPDLLFNTLGAAAGHPLGPRMGALLRPAARAAGRLARGWSLLFAAMVAATGWLTAPAPPPGPYLGQWTPEIGGHPRLPARILDARIGRIPIPDGPLAPENGVRAALESAAPLRVRWIAGWRIAAPAPLLRIVNPDGDEAAALFIDREDLVVVRHTRASGLRLDRPGLRAPGVIRGAAPGDTVTLTLRRTGRATAFASDAGWGARDGTGPGRGWALLFWTLGMRPGTTRGLDALWLFIWMAPLGLWLRRTPPSLAALGTAAAALVILPPLVHLAPVSLPEAIGAAAGLLGGYALRRTVRR
jgi:hypothetical protein